MATRSVLKGTVVAFDRDVGLGVVRSTDGAELGFHATAISDGTRHVEVGAEVTYEQRLAHAGAREARNVTPLGRPPQRRS